MIKKSVLWFVFLFSVNAVQAEVICEPDCYIGFHFESGGSIIAHSPMRFIYAPGSEITLGTTGTVNSAIQPASLDFSAGGELNLAAGESITFGIRGFFNLAEGSNLEADDFEVVTGDLIIIALNADVRMNGSLNVDGELFIDSLKIYWSDAITANELVSIGIDVNAIGDLDVLKDLSRLDGFTLTANDGVSCVVNGSECIVENGDIYVLKNDKLVKQNNASGSLDLYFIIFLLVLFLLTLPRRLESKG